MASSGCAIFEARCARRSGSTRCACIPASLLMAEPEDHKLRSQSVQGDIILVGLREYQDEKADVILKCVPACLPLGLILLQTALKHACMHACRYMADEARSLKAYGELPENSTPGSK